MSGLFNPGKLKRRVSFVELTQVSDGGGGYEDSITELFSVRAYIHPLTGREYFSNQQTDASVTHKITIRYKSDVKQSQVISYNGKLFDIQYILDVDEDHRFLELHTLERRQ